MNWQK